MLRKDIYNQNPFTSLLYFAPKIRHSLKIGVDYFMEKVEIDISNWPENRCCAYLIKSFSRVFN